MHECMKKNARVVCKVVFLLHDYRVNRTRTLRDISTSIALVSSLCVVVVHAGTNGGASVCAGAARRFLTRLRFLTTFFLVN